MLERLATCSLLRPCYYTSEEGGEEEVKMPEQNARAKNLAPLTPRLLLNRLLAAAWQTRKSSGARRFQGQARRLTRLWAQGELESKSTLRPCFPRNRNTGKGATQ